ncbi:MAG: hypothetical protein H6741_18970 [Alphaproteobacteria bacterium]|nr:hypothetical protein [Alphaproteobacteria bacterium]MCB9794793.1 hypothetical protein [Alphaproteobacteria bacterium]
MSDLLGLRGRDVRVIVNLTDEPAPVSIEGVKFIHHPLLSVRDDSDTQTLVKRCLNLHQACGGVIYVHCNAGYRRSPSLVYVLSRLGGRSAIETRALISQANPDAWLDDTSLERLVQRVEDQP